MSRYRKFAIAIVGAALVTIPIVWDLSVDQAEAAQLLIAWATALGIYQVPNDPPKGKRSKRGVSERGHADAALVLLAVMCAAVVVLAYDLIVNH